MSGVQWTRDLVAEGYSHNELAQLRRTGELRQIRRGAYDSAPVADAALRHLRLVEATVRFTAPSAVLSHLSAAVVHGLPVSVPSLGRVQLTRADVPGGKVRGGIHLYAAPLPDSDVVTVMGLCVTSLARTTVDVGRTAEFRHAVMTGDAALRRGLHSTDLQKCLLASQGRPGIVRARRVVPFLDSRSESPGESLSRVALHVARLPSPTLQYEVRDSSGRLVGRCDFAWEEHRTLGEFDGRVKYARLLKPNQTAADAVYAEKLREDALRDLGWQVVRWTYADLAAPMVIADRLRRAFARSVDRL